jgi:hypothetical protein
LLRRGIPRLEEDGSVVYSFTPQVAREVMEPFLAELSQRVEFRILGEYQALPVAETGLDQADKSGTAAQARPTREDTRFGTPPLGTRFDDGNVPQATPEPVSEENVKNRPSFKRSGGKKRDKATQRGVPEDIMNRPGFSGDLVS